MPPEDTRHADPLKRTEDFYAPVWKRRILRAADADHRISPDDLLALDRLFASEAALREQLTDAAQVAANYYAMFHDEVWEARMTKWRAALTASPAADRKEGP